MPASPSELCLHPSSSKTVLGVDGCPGGWLVVAVPDGDPAAAEVSLIPTFAAILSQHAAAALICVDIPIGLPERVEQGGRACDKAARSVLGARQSAVFSVPARTAVYANDYAEACARAEQHSDPPRKVSKQCFNLFPKIREVDQALTVTLQQKVIECHPEVAFWSLNGCQPLPEPKKVKSSPYQPGLELRRQLLRSAGFTKAHLCGNPFQRRQAGPDDLLDATACAAAAMRILSGQGHRFPEDPQIDAQGLRMEIWG